MAEERAKIQDLHKAVQGSQVRVLSAEQFACRELVPLAAEKPFILAKLLARQDLLLKLEGDITDPFPFGLRVVTNQFSPDMRAIALDCPGEGGLSRAVGSENCPVFSGSDLPGCSGEEHPVSQTQSHTFQCDQGLVWGLQMKVQGL